MGLQALRIIGLTLSMVASVIFSAAPPAMGFALFAGTSISTRVPSANSMS
jgi:hypothetical protein